MRMAAMQNGRILRFLMVIGIVVLTIFIYASYYSTPVMTMPAHMHLSAALVSTPVNPTNSSNVILVNNVNMINNSPNFNNAIDEGDAAGPKLLQKIPFDRDTNLSLTSDSSNIQPTANNIQKIIGRADTILKNLTSTPNSSTNQSSSASSAPRSLPKSPSALMTAAGGSRIAKGRHAAASLPFDPAKGIPTANIYESGHMDANPQICPDDGESIRLAIIITSAPGHRDARLAIRQTWGHFGSRRDVAVAFILGSTDNQTMEEALNAENYMYGDLIRGYFIDSYNNLTLKTISTLEWVDQNCPQADFVLKTDDDMFINIPKLLAFIDKHQHEKRVIYGRLAKRWKPIRNVKSKYYVAPSQFSAAVFPQFTTGPAYLMSADIVHELYEKALDQTYLKLEDVFTTGIVAQQLNIKRIHVNEFLNRRIAFNPCNIRKAISVHMIKSNEQFDLWKKLLDQTKCK